MTRSLLSLFVLAMGGVAMSAEPLKVEIVAHRGASFDAPENTLSALKLAWEQGADGSEFDIYLTSDGKIVACHDADTKRTAGVVKIVKDSTLDELRSLDVGSWKDPKFAGEKMPTLDELLAAVPDGKPDGKKVYIEVKCGPEIVPELVRVLQTTKLKPQHTPVISFNADVIAAVKQARPDLPAYWLFGFKKGQETSAETLIAKAQEIHADGLDLSATPELTSEMAAKIRAAGLRLDVYTVNEVEVARRMIDMGVQGITTDRPEWLREQLTGGEPVEPVSFKHAGIIEAWNKFGNRLTFGKGQTLALVDDGCDLSKPEWITRGAIPKVRVSYDSVDGDDNPKHEGKGYHGTTIGIPSSLKLDGKWGVAYNDQVAVIRALECCHCNVKDGDTVAAGLQWIIDNHQRFQITTVNLAPVDDQEHGAPVPTAIDSKLKTLRDLGIWVSAPTGNHDFSKGISWPACQPNCFAIGAVRAGKDEVYLDRHAKVDLVVPAAATSSSNAIACGAAIVLREAIEKAGYDWKPDGATLPEAMLAIMQRTGVPVVDPPSGRSYRRLDLSAAITDVFEKAKK